MNQNFQHQHQWKQKTSAERPITELSSLPNFPTEEVLPPYLSREIEFLRRSTVQKQQNQTNSWEKWDDFVLSQKIQESVQYFFEQYLSQVGINVQFLTQLNRETTYGLSGTPFVGNNFTQTSEILYSNPENIVFEQGKWTALKHFRIVLTKDKISELLQRHYYNYSDVSLEKPIFSEAIISVLHEFVHAFIRKTKCPGYKIALSNDPHYYEKNEQITTILVQIIEIKNKLAKLKMLSKNEKNANLTDLNKHLEKKLANTLFDTIKNLKKLKCASCLNFLFFDEDFNMNQLSSLKRDQETEIYSINSEIAEKEKIEVSTKSKQEFIDMDNIKFPLPPPIPKKNTNLYLIELWNYCNIVSENIKYNLQKFLYFEFELKWGLKSIPLIKATFLTTYAVHKTAYTGGLDLDSPLAKGGSAGFVYALTLIPDNLILPRLRKGSIMGVQVLQEKGFCLLKDPECRIILREEYVRVLLDKNFYNTVYNDVSVEPSSTTISMESYTRSPGSDLLEDQYKAPFNIVAFTIMHEMLHVLLATSENKDLRYFQAEPVVYALCNVITKKADLYFAGNYIKNNLSITKINEILLDKKAIDTLPKITYEDIGYALLSFSLTAEEFKAFNVFYRACLALHEAVVYSYGKQGTLTLEELLSGGMNKPYLNAEEENPLPEPYSTLLTEIFKSEKFIKLP